MAYEAMKKWWRFLCSMTKSNILYFSKYGDWVPPAIVRTIERAPGEIISTWILHRDAVLLSEIASVLGRIDEVSYFKKLRKLKKLSTKNFSEKRNAL